MSAGQASVPVRKRPSWSQRAAAVALLLRAAGPEGQPAAAHVRAVADQHGVTTSAVYGWLRDPRLRSGAPKTTRRKQFVIGPEHLVVVANEQSALDAHAVLVGADLVSCSYATFARALAKADPALVQGAYSGHPGFVNNRVHLRFAAPHRAHTWHWDHTTADVWVWPSHKHGLPVRPYVSVLVDSATGYWLAVAASVDPVNAEWVAALFAQAAALREEHGTVVGGLPAVMTFDNAAEHHADAIQQGSARLGIIPNPTAAYHPWQNGKAERPVGLINKKLAAKLPGATAKQAGTLENGDPRFAAAAPREAGSGHALAWDVFTTMLEALRTKVNTTYKMQRLGGLTRAQAWAADPTELAQVEAEVVAHAMLKAHKHHVVNGDGVHFCKRTYVAAGMVAMRGQRVKVRHFPTNPDFIEIFGLDDEYLFRAWDTDRLTPEQKAGFMAARRKQEDDNRAVQAGVVAHRRHLAVVLNEMSAEETTALDDGSAPDEAGPASINGVDTPAPRAKRPKLPRAPRGPRDPDENDRKSRSSAVARLGSLQGKRDQPALPATTRDASTDPEEPS